MTIIGVDPHLGSHTAVALDRKGKRLGAFTFDNTTVGLSEFQGWLSGYEVERCAIEGVNRPLTKKQNVKQSRDERA